MRAGNWRVGTGERGGKSVQGDGRVSKDMRQTVFIAGATGYMGRRLAAELLERGHTVRGLTRAGSEARLAPGCTPVHGDALDASTYAGAIAPATTFIHLVGTPHPAPWKAKEFEAVDLRSVREAVAAAEQAGVDHFVYVSVAHPAPAMKAYIRVRTECERLIAQSGLRATVLRPWYVLGPGHRWPVVLKPMYWAAERVPSLRDGARRLGLVTIGEMVSALAWTVENPARAVLEVPDIRATAQTTTRAAAQLASTHQRSCPEHPTR